MVKELTDWGDIIPKNAGPIPGVAWAADIVGETSWQHESVEVEVEPEREPSPDYYEARLLATYGDDARLPAKEQFSVSVRLDHRRGSKGYVLHGETKREQIELPGFPADGGDA